MCVYASCHQLKKSINTCKEKNNNNQKQPEEEEQQQNNPKSDYAYQFLRLYIHRWAVETKNDDDRTPKRMGRRIHMARKSLNEKERKGTPLSYPKRLVLLSTRYSPDEEFVEYALTGVCVSTLRQELLRLNSSAIGARCPSGVGSITYKPDKKKQLEKFIC